MTQRHGIAPAVAPRTLVNIPDGVDAGTIAAHVPPLESLVTAAAPCGLGPSVRGRWCDLPSFLPLTAKHLARPTLLTALDGVDVGAAHYSHRP